MKFLIQFIIIVILTVSGSGCQKNKQKNTGRVPGNDSLSWNDLTKDEQDFLDSIERRSFEFFRDNFNTSTGLIADAGIADNRCSIASVGFGLSAYCIADARGWMDHREVYDRVLTTLQSFYKDPENDQDFCVEGTHGLFYHFVEMDSGRRFAGSEVSTIDSGILLAGILQAMVHFRGTEVEELARKIWLAAEWEWFLQNDGAMAGAWSPENGLTGRFTGYNEYMIVYLLALGSPSHPAPCSSWKVWASTYKWVTYKDIPAFLTPGGQFKPLAYLYQFPACWFDLRGKKDKYADYWTSDIRALTANRQYCMDWGEKHDLPGELWGWTASNGKDGYLGYDVPYNGTIAPSAVAASLPFIPEYALTALNYMYANYKDKIWGKYGFTDAFNPLQNWYDTGYLGIDQGNTLLMIENFRSGMVWQEFMSVPDVQEGMKKAGLIN